MPPTAHTAIVGRPGESQTLGVQLPYQIFLALPYIVAILALALSRARSKGPQSLGLPYTRE